MYFYKTARSLLESLDSGVIPGKELLQSYVMSLFDMEREATIVYDFLEKEGYLDKGMYMAITGKGNYDPNDMPNFYVIIPHSVLVGKHRFLLNFWDKWKALAKENNFHFLLKAGEDMLIQGKELVTSSYTILKWRPMKKKTREHFGDILKGLNENKEEKWAYLLKMGKKKDGTEFARYKFLPYSSLSEEDFEIAEQLHDNTKDYAHGRYEDRTDIKVYINTIGHKIKGYRTILFYVGPKEVLEKELYEDKKYQYGTRMKEEIKLKPKTQKHFGKILSGLNEEITSRDIESSARAHERLKRGSNPDHVIIFLYYGNDSHMQNQYIFKPVRKLKGKEIEIYKIMIRNKIESGHNEKFNVSVFLDTSDQINFMPGLQTTSMYKGDKRDLDEFLKYYLWVNKADNFVEKKPIMNKKAERHFGDIIDAL